MIPILYEYNETAFTSHGLCYLSDCIEAEVLEQRNGQFELAIRYPITGANFAEIEVERIIGVYTNDGKTIQGFRIYDITRPLNGLVTIYARHVAYDMSGIPCPAIDGTYTPVAAMNLLFAGTNFTGWSTINTSQQVKMSVPVSVYSMLGGIEGSLLDLFGGEYEFNNYQVKLHAHRGADNGVIVEYGKNITQLTDEFSTEDVYSSILPYAIHYGDDGSETTIRGTKVSFSSMLERDKCLIVDFTDRFDYEEVPTVERLDALAQQYIEANNLGTAESNINVSFIPLWYDNGGEAIALCDTIYIRHERLGVDAKAKVIETTYDVLKERFTRITCGKATSNFVHTVVEIQQEDNEVKGNIVTLPGKMAQAIAYATKLITGNSGGNVVLHEGANGKPFELLVMDNADINQAVNVWRWNLGGLGFSSNGYAGPYETAITQDGQINSNMLTTRALTVVDNADNVLFEADPDSRTVQIAGFGVSDGGLNFTITYPSESGLGNATYTMDMTQDGITNTLTDYVTTDEEGNPVTPYLYTTTSHMDEGIFEVTDGYGNHAELVSDRIRFKHSDGRLIALGPMYEKYNNSSTATAQTYTFSNIPHGVYLVFHCKQTTPTLTSTGIQLLIIGSADPGAAIIRDISTGSDIGAGTSSSSYSTITATCNGDRTGNVVWKTKGASGYRKLILLRLN